MEVRDGTRERGEEGLKRAKDMEKIVRCRKKKLKKELCVQCIMAVGGDREGREEKISEYGGIASEKLEGDRRNQQL